jgi:hypothetical protein
MKNNNIISAIDIVCLNCVEDTLNNENVCDNCPVRKLSNKLEREVDNYEYNKRTNIIR